MQGLEFLEPSEQLSCFGGVISILLQFRNKLKLLRNMMLSEANVRLGLGQIPL
jgi:hypothetical protein